MTNPFKAIASLWTWLQRVLGPAASIIQQISEKALPLVRIIAALTPTRADDEIIALFERYAIPNARLWLALPPEQRGAALGAVALAEMKRLYPNVPTEQIRAAIELALSIYRQQQTFRIPG